MVATLVLTTTTHGEQYCSDFDPSTVLRYQRKACWGDVLRCRVSTIYEMADGTKPAAREEAGLERVVDVAYEERLNLPLTWSAAVLKAARTRRGALAKLKSDPYTIRALVDLSAIASSPPLRRLTARRKVGLLPGEALQRLKDDLANATDLEPVVVYAAGLRNPVGDALSETRGERQEALPPPRRGGR